MKPSTPIAYSSVLCALLITTGCNNDDDNVSRNPTVFISGNPLSPMNRGLNAYKYPPV
jgi:hypothetical protein